MLICAGVLFVPSRTSSAGLLTSGMTSLYAAYLLISALSSEPHDDTCMRGSGTSPRWIQVPCSRASVRLHVR